MAFVQAIRHLEQAVCVEPCSKAATRHAPVRLQNRRPSDSGLLCIVVRTGWYVAPARGTLKAAVVDVCPAALRLVDSVRRDDVAGKVAIIEDTITYVEPPLREPVERRLRLFQGAQCIAWTSLSMPSSHSIDHPCGPCSWCKLQAFMIRTPAFNHGQRPTPRPERCWQLD